MTGVLIRRGEGTDRHTGRTSCDNGDRDWTEVSRGQGAPRSPVSADTGREP